MQKIRRKLNSSSGASILIAMLYLLVALMVGTVILTAANTGTNRIAKEKESLQNQLAVESAVKLLTADIQEESFTGKYIYWTSSTYIPAVYDEETGELVSAEYSESDDGYQKSGATKLAGESRFLDSCEQSIVNMYYNQTGAETGWTGGDVIGEYTYTITADKMPAVNCNMMLGEDYSLSAVVSLADGSNSVSVYFAPEVRNDTNSISSESGYTTTMTTTYTTTVTWRGPVITKLTGRAAS